MPKGFYLHKTKAEPEERFWPRVELPLNESDCWLWTGFVNSGGYGIFYLQKKHVVAHRYSYTLLKGEIPKGLDLDHLCRNRRCVNPSHLEAVTRSENVRRGLMPSIGRAFQIGKTHCPQGHPYDGFNTYIRPDGGRDCKICCRIRAKKARRIKCLKLKSLLR